MPDPGFARSFPSVPRVSVILTVYKRTEYLRQALESVLTQSFTDYEVIVADDSGTSVAKESVAAYISERVKYLPHPSTLGIASSLVRAVGQTRGRYIAVLNDDDLWENDFLASLVPVLDADPERVLAFCDHWMMDSNGNIEPALSDSWSRSFARACLSGGVVPSAAEFIVANRGVALACGALFRKDALEWPLVVDEVRGAYDYWISCLLARTGKPVYYVPQRLTRYRVHATMETLRRSHDKDQNLVYIFTKLLDEGWFPELRGYLRGKLIEALLTTGRDKLHFGRRTEARRYFWRCFTMSFRFRPLILAAVSLLPNFAEKALRACLRQWRGVALPGVGTGLGTLESGK